MTITNLKLHRMCSYTDTKIVENTIPSSIDCSWCDAKVGDTHSRACPNGERYKQVQQLTASGKSLPEIIPGYIEIAWGEFTSSKVNAKDKRENKKGLILEDI